MKQTFTTKILNYILVILGFAVTSCDKGYLCAYGTPTMDFQISGKVVNKANEPIPGIKVTSPYSPPDKNSVFTAEDGTFSISGLGVLGARLEFKDIDGPEIGGEYADLLEEIKVNQVQKGDGAWYMGMYEAKDVVINMKEKEKE